MLTAVGLLFACDASAQSLEKVRAIEEGLAKMQALPALSGSQISIEVRKVGNGEEIFGYQAAKWMMPASTLKLLTTLAFLDEIKDDTLPSTKVFWSPMRIQNGVYKGDIVIVGSGEASFLSQYVPKKTSYKSYASQLISLLKVKGVKTIEGRIIVNIANLPEIHRPASWLMDDIANYYGTCVTGLNFQDNQFSLELMPGKLGEPVRLGKLSLPLDSIGYAVINEATYGSTDKSYFVFPVGRPEIVLKGEVAVSDKPQNVKGALSDPPLMFGQLIKRELQKGFKGSQIVVNVDKSEFSPKTADALLLNWSSLVPSQQVKITNSLSLNHYAESLGKLLERKTGNKSVLYDYSRKLGMQVPRAGQLKDASGMSPMNRLTASDLNALLLAALKSDEGVKSSFLNSLPKLGIEGTLQYICVDCEAKGKIIGKSGSGNDAMNLAGYVIDEKGRPQYTFAVMINNHLASFREIRKALELVLVPISNLQQ